MAPFYGGRREGGAEWAGGQCVCVGAGITGARLCSPGKGMPTCQLEVWAPSSGGHGGAPSHFPDSGQIFPLILPRSLHLAATPSPPGRARPFPRLRGKHLANCRFGPVTPADDPSRGKGQGTGPGIQGFAHGSRGSSLPVPHELWQAQVPGLPPPIAPTCRAGRCSPSHLSP